MLATMLVEMASMIVVIGAVAGSAILFFRNEFAYAKVRARGCFHAHANKKANPCG